MDFRKRKLAAGVLLAAALGLSGCGDEAAKESVPAEGLVQKIERAVSSAPRGEAEAHRAESVRYGVPEGVSVFMYHMIGDIPGNAAVMTEENLRRQLDYLRDNGWHPITMAELADFLEKGAPLPEKPVCLTFDDGYEDNYKIVFPLMKEYGFPWTVFVITGDVGNPGRLTWDEINEMAGSGAVTVASHTVTHPHLSALTEEEIRNEIAGAGQALREKAGVETPWLAYPYGDYDGRVKAIAKEEGIRLAVTMDEGRPAPGSDALAVTRIWIGNGVDDANYEERLTTENYTRLE